MASELTENGSLCGVDTMCHAIRSPRGLSPHSGAATTRPKRLRFFYLIKKICWKENGTEVVGEMFCFLLEPDGVSSPAAAGEPGAPQGWPSLLGGVPWAVQKLNPFLQVEGNELFAHSGVMSSSGPAHLCSLAPLCLCEVLISQ